MEATPGFEPGIRVLQTRALPLGYIAVYKLYEKLNKKVLKVLNKIKNMCSNE